MIKGGGFIPAVHSRPVATFTNGSHENNFTPLGRAWVKPKFKRTTETGAADQQINQTYITLQARAQKLYQPEDVLVIPGVGPMPDQRLRVTGIRPMENEPGLWLDCVEVLA